MADDERVDPFEILGAGFESVEPDPLFLSRLRERLVAAEQQPLDAHDPIHDRDTTPSGPAGTLIDLDQHMDALARTPRRRKLLLGGAAIAAAAALVAVLVNRDDKPRQLDITDTTTPTVNTTNVPAPTSSPTTTKKVASNLPPVQDLSELEIGSRPVSAANAVAAADGVVVLYNFDTSTVELLDPVTGETRVTVQTPVAMGVEAAVSSNAVWLASADSQGPSTVLRISPTTGELASIPVPDGVVQGQYPAVDPTGAWFIGRGTPKLVHIGNDATAVDATIALPAQAAAVAAGQDALWIARTDGQLSRVDPVTGAELSSAPLPLEVTWQLARLDEQLWAYGLRNGELTLARYHAGTGEYIDATTLGRSGSPWQHDLAAGAGALWLITGEASLTKIDPATNTVISRYGSGGGANGFVAVEQNTVWLYSSSTLYRLRAS